MNKAILKDKLTAFRWHFILSILIASISLILVYFIWYPAPLAKAIGVGKIYWLMLIIDVILGPFLTFLVYKKSKNTLKFDLCIILLIQLTAFFYGLYTMYEGKPAWIVYDVDRFQLVRINDVYYGNNSTLADNFKSLSLLNPKYIASIVPKDNKEIVKNTMFDEVFSGISPAQRPEFYHPLEEVKGQIQNRALPLENLKKFNDGLVTEAILSNYPQADSYVPLKATTADMAVLINKKAGGEVVKIVDLRPW